MVKRFDFVPTPLSCDLLGWIFSLPWRIADNPNRKAKL